MKKKKLLAKMISMVLIALLLTSSVTAYAAEGPGLGPLFESGMPKTGTAKVVGICVDFADMKFEDGDDENALEEIINAESDETNPFYPFESLHAYYQRASYGKLNITGDVYTYHSPNNREYYEDKNTLFTEAMNALDDTVDFSKYDGNDDGKIDAVYIHFAGEDTGWNSQWWSKAWYFEDGATYDGKAVFNRVLLHNPSNTLAGPHTLIHETGHVLGLPDLYAYDNTTEGRTGTLSWDLMENNTGDINGYFKWLLGWIDEAKITKVVANESGVKITRGGETIKEILPDENGCSEVELSLDSFDTDILDECGGFIALSNKEIEKYSSFYLIQYETHSGNQSVQYYDEFTQNNYDIPNGFRVYRVQGDVNSYTGSFVYQNITGPLHNQLIEVLDMDESDNHNVKDYLVPKGVNVPNHKCFLGEGGVINCSTYPSTNFKENNLLGFTGLTIECLSTEETSGKLLLGFSPDGRKDPSEFNLELMESEQGINDFTVRFITPWAVEQLEYDGFVYINDKEYPASVRLSGNTVEVHAWLNPEDLRQGDVCTVKFPKKMFKVAEIGLSEIFSEEISVSVPIGPQAEIDERIIVDSVTPEDSMSVFSNTVVGGDKAYMVWLNDPYGEASLHISEFIKDNPGNGIDSVIDGFAKEYFYTLNNDSFYLYKAGDNEVVLKIRAYDNDENLLDYYYWINLDTKAIENSYVHNNSNGFAHYYNNVTVGDDGTIFIIETDGVRMYCTAVANENGEIKSYTDSKEMLSSNFGIYRATDPATNKDYILLRQFVSSDYENGINTYSVHKIESADLKDLIKSNDLANGFEEKSECVHIEVESSFDFMTVALSTDGVMAVGKLYEYDPVDYFVGRDYIVHFDKSGKLIGKMRLERLNVLNGSEFFNITVDTSHVFVSSESRNSETGNWNEKIIFNVADIANVDSSKECAKYICTNIHAGGYFVEPDKFLTFYLNSDYSTGKNELVSYIIKVDNNEIDPKPESKPDTKTEINPDSNSKAPLTGDFDKVVLWFITGLLSIGFIVVVAGKTNTLSK